MRNSINNHNLGPLCVSLAGTSLACFWALATWAAEPDFTIRSEDMVVVHADQAWEEAEPETLRFAGNFEMRVRDWVFRADSATLNGTLNDPRRVVLNGSPARIDLPAADPAGVIRGEAREIVYLRSSATVQLLGGAELEQGENLLQSNRIDYDIRSDRVRAAGVSGVQIRIRP